MQGIVVFLGPSLPRDEAAGILPASYLPPARRGDIPGAVEEGARLIGLIDGVFFQDCSVGHREILDAISRGVRVVGASSMGALRAAELDTLGMEGVGEVYRLYRDGTLISDDEVALVFDPETGIALSEPLINIRCTLRDAEKKKVVDSATGDRILSLARSVYFPERTWDRILELAEGQVDPGTLRRFSGFVTEHPVDQKRDDAIAALHRIREIGRELDLL
ncbi:hypothetical protein J2741_000806 [Methanolinea mesophila]|uniref:TfuA-related McrA-glycine thioamidation protein n=1 Tax=Methanolinea mesophila TaxID=547055 RepID=UPI001AE1B3EE|nr:TfuA-related McrA-glycine thioamidation protein [Methanolinea mesophila]MBP1928259.1 hypothetical protein [Methanolinea mesophila]